ncbi:flagellar motor protein MotA [Paenibacillus sp. FSL H7-0357]|uniref:flagellar motor protein n=1 Tax=Paenibacillus sp. FSL H7-0357 TaxID=1536774 RepID=UPI0004F59C66|nr:flagellar motor protein [Paenibacillus sp. FSL H7-0357]AIQ20849.1 flagellar motor protein MotA [Paenibacillus sp. FSL H7-0357]
MDITAIIGLLAGLAAMIGGFFWEGGNLSGLLQPNAALIVFGGTLAAVLISFPASKLRHIPAALRMAFGRHPDLNEQNAEELISMAAITRRGGVLLLEQKAEEHPNPFTREGLLLIVDGTDADEVRQILELDMDAKELKYNGYAKIFEAAGGYAPTMGIIGTVMGLIHVLSNLTDPSNLGASIAVAFTATLYGVASANLIFLPIASKIKSRSQTELAGMEMLLVGILALQNGDHPQLVRKKLSSFTADSEGSRKREYARGLL